MEYKFENLLPREIEKRSFQIITEELNGRIFPEMGEHASGRITGN